MDLGLWATATPEDRASKSPLLAGLFHRLAVVGRRAGVSIRSKCKGGPLTLMEVGRQHPARRRRSNPAPQARGTLVHDCTAARQTGCGLFCDRQQVFAPFSIPCCANPKTYENSIRSLMTTPPRRNVAEAGVMGARWLKRSCRTSADWRDESADKLVYLPHNPPASRAPDGPHHQPACKMPLCLKTLALSGINAETIAVNWSDGSLEIQQVISRSAGRLSVP